MGGPLFTIYSVIRCVRCKNIYEDLTTQSLSGLLNASIVCLMEHPSGFCMDFVLPVFFFFKLKGDLLCSSGWP